MIDQLPTDMMINAHIRIAARDGVPITVVKRGHDGSGSIVLKINRLDGTVRVLSQVRHEDELAWTPVSKADPMDECDADRYLTRQIERDPDCWVLEIEDRQGRHWFPGRIIA